MLIIISLCFLLRDVTGSWNPILIEEIQLNGKMVPFLSMIFVITTIRLVSTHGYKPMDDPYQTKVIYGNYSKNITVTVSADTEYIIHFEDSISHLPYTVYAWSDQSNSSFPVFIMVRQQKEATSWEIPLLVQSREGILSFYKTSRTLCHNNINSIGTMPRNTLQSKNHDGVQKYELHKRLTLSVSTAYDIPTNVTVRVEEQDDFFLTENQNYSVTISPSEPRFFYYKFPDRHYTDTGATVILEVESADDTCLIVSIQHATCPVFDLNEDISYEGEYETVNIKGGIIIKESAFPNGLFVVLVAKADNFDCDQKNSMIPSQTVPKIKPSNHSSVVIFKITPNIGQDKYIAVSVSTLAGFLLFYVVFGIIYCEFCSSYKRCTVRVSEGGYQSLPNENGVEDPVPGGSVQTGVSCETSTGGTAVIERNSNLSDGIQSDLSEINNFCNSSDRTLYKSIEEEECYQSVCNEIGAEHPVPSVSVQIEVPRETCTGGTEVIVIERNSNMSDGIQTKTSEINNCLNSLESTLYKSIEKEECYQSLRNEEDAVHPAPVGSVPIEVLRESGTEVIQRKSDSPDGNSVENNSIDHKLLSSQLFLSDLSTKEPKHIHRESINYFLHVISIGIFYAIPVVQLVITHQRIVTITGNLDKCYYNFLCAHPIMGLNDYNHVLSNIGYVLLGVLFVIITRLHKKMRHDDNLGIPKHYGLFYAMGTALIMEGILSACYHVCPNQSNFQFDTTFMYVMAVLCIIKLYENRHPDINATAYVTFVILAIAVLIAMVGILNGHILIWVFFIILYSVLCLYIAIKIYFVNQSTRGFELVYEMRKDKGILKAIKPIKKDRCIAVVIITILNIVMVNLGFLCHTANVDFGTFLLSLLMGNTIIYTATYVSMKIKCKETLGIEPMIYLIVAAILWGFATYFFVNNSSKWTETPAESRQWNTECTIFDFYDYHDIWHLLSATALFFSFMLLLTIDDKLVNIPRDRIVVF